MPYVIDGNNLLGSWGGRAVSGRSDVLRRVAAFCRSRGSRAVLVFDGRPMRGDLPAQTIGPVELRFPEPGQDADSVIRALVDGSARPADLIVVTSDKALYSYARTRGAAVMRAHEWNRIERSIRGGAASDDGEKPTREDDVAGWLRRFGGEEYAGNFKFPADNSR
jgi:predicted RNA-binding protein with PIN domain